MGAEDNPNELESADTQEKQKQTKRKPKTKQKQKKKVKRKPKVHKTRAAQLREDFIKDQIQLQKEFVLISDPFWFNAVRCWSNSNKINDKEFEERFKRFYPGRLPGRKIKRVRKRKTCKEGVTLLKIPEADLRSGRCSKQDIVDALIPVIGKHLSKRSSSPTALSDLQAQEQLELKTKLIEEVEKIWSFQNEETRSADVVNYEIGNEEQVIEEEIENLKPVAMDDASEIKETPSTSRTLHTKPPPRVRPRPRDSIPKRFKLWGPSQSQPTSKYGIHSALQKLRSRSTDPKVEPETTSRILGSGYLRLAGVKEKMKEQTPVPVVTSTEIAVQTIITEEDLKKMMECKCKKLPQPRVPLTNSRRPPPQRNPPIIRRQ